MAEVKPKRTNEEVVDEILKRVLHVTLAAPLDSSASQKPGGGASDIVYLEQLAAELLSEGLPVRLSADVVERAVMARLSMGEDSMIELTGPAAKLTPLDYAVGAYMRCLEEGRKANNIKDAGKLKMVQTALEAARDLLVSYAGLYLQHPDMFPSPPPPPPPPAPYSKPSSPLTFYIVGDPPPLASSLSAFLPEQPGHRLPSGFLSQLTSQLDSEALAAVAQPVFSDLAARVFPMSIMGPFQGPLAALVHLTASFPPLAHCLVTHPRWNPVTQVGRVQEAQSLLGPFLRISIIPDSLLRNGAPDARQQLFSRPSQRRQSEFSSSFLALRSAAHQLWDGLHELLVPLLRSPDTREHVLDLMAAYIRVNSKRSGLQIDHSRLASHGLFFNLGAVLLKLCQPFVDAAGSKLDRIDPSYVLGTAGRVSFSDLTALFATSEEVASWVDARNFARQETFRLTQRQREEQELKWLQEEARRHQGSVGAANGGSGSSVVSTGVQIGVGSAGSGSTAALSSVAATVATVATAGASVDGSPSAPQKQSFNFITECFFLTARALNLGLLRVQSELTTFNERAGRDDREALRVLEAMRGEGQPPDLEQQIAQLQARMDTIKEFMLCYTAALQDVELIQQALRFYHLMILWLVRFVGGFHLPLPAPCPKDWASMPEHLVDDAMEVLLMASRMHNALDGVNLDDFMSFIVMFMGSPLYIKNPYLRAKMVEVLQLWMPSHAPSAAAKGRCASLFEGHPLAMSYLTPNLLKLYVDIEFTGSHNAFYEKFSIRFRIAELLEYLWEVPSHRAAWIRMSELEQAGFYLKYVGLLVDDTVHLLDGALEKIPALREEEAAQARQAEWLAIPVEERREREQNFQRDQSLVRYNMQLANSNVRMLQYSTTEIVDPFLLPEIVERLASMLNFCLLQLVGARRKELRVHNPEKYEFHPKQLLSRIVEVYANVSAADKTDRFAEAVGLDSRYYKPELFTEAASVLRLHRLLPDDLVRQFEALGRRAQQLASEAEDLEGDQDDIPAEYLDPVQCTIMRDPVILPSKMVMDRRVISRHLLSDPKDPFTRAHLTPDMLVPHHELREQIEKFLADQRAKKSSS